MSAELQPLKDAYLAIGSHDDHLSAYIAFEAELKNLSDSPDFDPEALPSIFQNKDNQDALNAMWTTRRIQTYMRGEPNGFYFRGTGAIAIATKDNLLAYSYSDTPSERPVTATDEEIHSDPVADVYENYQLVVVKKLGRGLLLALEGTSMYPFTDAYHKLQDKLVEAGVQKPQDPPHHLGYAWRGNLTNPVVAGATGMLRDPSDAEVRARANKVTLDCDRRRGWLEDDIDRFAGLDDAVAAHTSLGLLQGLDIAAAFSTVGQIQTLHAAGVNLH